MSCRSHVAAVVVARVVERGKVRARARAKGRVKNLARVKVRAKEKRLNRVRAKVRERARARTLPMTPMTPGVHHIMITTGEAMTTTGEAKVRVKARARAGGEVTNSHRRLGLKRPLLLDSLGQGTFLALPGCHQPSRCEWPHHRLSAMYVFSIAGG